jgi:hypothetical protein
MEATLDSGSRSGCDNNNDGKEEVEENDNHKTVTALAGGGRQRGPTMARRVMEEPLPEPMQPPSH